MNEDQLEATKTTVAIAMSAILITTSAVTLPMMLSVSNKVDYLLNDLFFFVGFGAIITSSLLIDSVLDKYEISFKKRWKLMGGGYLAFSFLIALLGIVTIALFLFSENILIDKPVDHTIEYRYTTCWFFFFTGLFIFVKLMTQEDYNIFTYLILLWLIASYVLLKFQQFIPLDCEGIIFGLCLTLSIILPLLVLCPSNRKTICACFDRLICF